MSGPRMVTITIQQLDASGKVWRSFTLHRYPEEVPEALDRVRLGYNMQRTRVLADGQPVEALEDGPIVVLPEAPRVCEYSAAHRGQQVNAVTLLDCGQVGAVPACERCASFFERMGGRRLPT